jgi:putative intracellular protease/amidase
MIALSCKPMRWIYHIFAEDSLPDIGSAYAPASLQTEGFVHGSFAPTVDESARLYFKGPKPLWLLKIDPRRVRRILRIEETPRGPMPHLYGAIVRDAIVEVLPFTPELALEDAIKEHRACLVTFAQMTLLDLVSVYDPLRRLAPQGLVCNLVSADRAYSRDGIVVDVPIRPPLCTYDVLVIAGGLGTRALVHDPHVIAWLQTFPITRLVASVCTGALLLGAAGRLQSRCATTHRSELARLASYGASADMHARVVDEGDVVTASGVTTGLELGLALVAILSGTAARDAIAMQMEVHPGIPQTPLYEAPAPHGDGRSLGLLLGRKEPH